MQQDIENAKIDLIQEMGIDQMPQDKQEEILLQMGEIMQQRIVERFATELPEEKQAQFLELISDENTTQETMDAFIAENLPQSEELILEEIGKYKKESVELFKQISEQ